MRGDDMIIMNLGNFINGAKRYPKINNPDLQWDDERKAYYCVSYCKNGDEIISKTTTYLSPDIITLSSKINCWFKRTFNNI